ncbi:MAG TPA: thioredoxin domain-containing protein [Candidatus Kryptonia bacterium]|nr:thioredoxin domain-containing protein [Candidatus Kryptonia bacterium]
MQRTTRTASLALLLLALLGVAVSGEIYSLHRRLAAEVGFASFCNVNAVVNCDVVLTSPYAKLLGVPVALWAGAYYLLLAGFAGLAWRGAGRGVSAAVVRTGRRAATWAFAHACFGLVVSGYFAILAFAVIQAVCLMCGGLYLIAAAVWLAAWRLRRASAGEMRGRAAARAPRDRWATLAAAGLTVAVVAGAGWEAFGPRAHGLTAAEVAERRPDFYAWYLKQPVVAVPADEGREIGPASAPVTIVSYSDFECGHCAALARSLHETLPRYQGQVRVVFHHYPLDRACNPKVTTDMHQRACRAAVAAECAAQQDRFWPYHDVLFENQQRLADSDLLSYAQRVGLNVAQFESCLASAAPLERVERDIRAGTALGIESTPTVFINGRRIKGALDPELLGYALGIARGSAHP